MTQTFKGLPTVFSLERAVVITTGIMKNRFEDGTTSLIEVIRHGILGTQNFHEESKEVSLVQTTETARTAVDAIGSRTEFNLRVNDIAHILSNCTPGALQKQDIGFIKNFKLIFHDYIARAKDSQGIDEVALRYARNIANGRWMWRNRKEADSATVYVDFNDVKLTFIATEIPFNDFANYSADEKILGAHIARCLRGTGKGFMKIMGDIDFGFKGSVEVYPSQDYIDNKPKGFARSLYKHSTVEYKKNDKGSLVVGYAAIRDQKIGNALRTYDTWYADYENHGVPIAIEPNGANLDAQEFFRKGKATNEDSAFSLFTRLSEIDPSSPEGMFCIGCMIRGGVYNGKSEKDAQLTATEKVTAKAAAKAKKQAIIAEVEEG